MCYDKDELNNLKKNLIIYSTGIDSKKRFGLILQKATLKLCISLYISSGIFLSALAAVMGSRLNGLYLANGSVCGFTFYQPKEPDLHELFERRDLE